MIHGGWRSRRQSKNPGTRDDDDDDDDDDVVAKTRSQAQVEATYEDFPLVRDMMLHQEERVAALEWAGRKQIEYTKSNEGWFRTVLVLEGRALDKFVVPWALVSLNAIIWTTMSETADYKWANYDSSAFQSFVGLVLNTALAFLLVFRLNRSATRYWSARQSWGTIIALNRTMVGGLLVHGHHDPSNRDQVIRWCVAGAVATMQYMHGILKIYPESLAGILTKEDIKRMEKSSHFGLYAADEMRYHLKELFQFDSETSIAIAQGRTLHMNTLELQLNEWILQIGALERIRATPLPLVYVTHLRTFLLLFLFAVPYVWESALGWATIPLTIISSFALLGLEGAAQEVEAPFLINRTNHLAMEAYCLLLLQNTQQQIKQAADRELLQRRSISPMVTAVDGMSIKGISSPDASDAV